MPSVRIARLDARITELAKIGALEGGGVARLALTKEDGRGRDLVTAWMHDLGLALTVDRIGNVIAVRPDRTGSIGRPVLMGSHIDTVATGGSLDGNLGVLAGLEVIETLNDHGIATEHPVAVGFFTNEEGARFAPDMLGSGVHQGVLDLDTCLATRSIDGSILSGDLTRIGYAGDEPSGGFRAHAYFELHIEQGPVLEEEGFTIGAVTGVQGISWTEWRLSGVSNHAGTTPMGLRHDAGLVAAELACFVRWLAEDLGEPQVATVGAMTFTPNLVNVIANEVVLTVDLRNTDDMVLRTAEARTLEFAINAAKREGIAIESRSLARFSPVAFDPAMIDLVEHTATSLGYPVKRLPSGAGHDAQMFAPNCPTAMIFVPSAGGISHNAEESTKTSDLESGANVLLRVVLKVATGSR